MSLYSYPALFAPEGHQEAKEFAMDAIETVLAEYMRRQLSIPKPTQRRGGKHTHWIELPLLTQAKLSLYSAMKSEAVRKADLARRMGISKSQVERLLNPAHASRLETIESAFRVLKKRLGISVQDAA